MRSVAAGGSESTDHIAFLPGFSASHFLRIEPGGTQRLVIASEVPDAGGMQTRIS
jgi:hypothetical protein